MTDFIDGLEADLVAAAPRRHAVVAAGRPEPDGQRVVPRWRRWLPPGPLTLAGALVLATGAAAAGGTLLVLRGGTINPPPAVAPEQTPLPSTGRLLTARVTDPAVGQPAWTLRLARGKTGLVCSTVGQVRGGEFGLVGLDGRFRVLAPEVADACSAPRANASTLVGVRTFTGRQGTVAARSVVSGVGGPQLRSVHITARGRSQQVPVRSGGTFLAVFAGLPEDLQLRVSLQFADGHREAHPFGVSPGVLADPAGGHAWSVQASTGSNDARVCVQVRPARQGPAPALSKAACGTLGPDIGHRRGLYFDVIRMTPSTRKRALNIFVDGLWHEHPPRTLVLGAAGSDVRSVTAMGPPGQPHTGTRVTGPGSFAEMFGPDVRPDQITVRVVYTNGHTITYRHHHGLKTRPIPVPSSGKAP
jgi:hypothetical protein